MEFESMQIFESTHFLPATTTLPFSPDSAAEGKWIFKLRGKPK